ncbi:MAG: VanZ family protein [Flavobacteriales bacterium]|nr:VanZ family protein [Flavobacteriales bacterium]
MAMLRHLRWALLWALLILLLCLMPGAALPTWRWADLMSVDKLVHAGLFAGLFILCAGGLARHYGSNVLRSSVVLTTAILAVAYGGLLETMQNLPALGRRGDWNDFIANTTGVAAGWGWYRWRRTDQRPSAGAVDV